MDLLSAAHYFNGVDMDEETVKAAIRAAVQAVREARTIIDRKPEGIFSGCCYLTENTVRECFDDFIEDECQKAAKGCGYSHQFVSGGKC